MKNADTSVAMGSDKARHVRETGAEVLVAGDNSCLMHVGGLLSRQRGGRPRHAPRRGARGARRESHDATFVGMPAFPMAARAALADTQLRHNLAHATGTIRDKRARVVAEVDDWEDLRTAGAAIKDRTLHDLASYLVQLEASLTAAGATVHWARDAAEANAVVAAVAKAHGVDEVVKVKSMATQEIGLNEALAEEGIAAWETDLAELIVQLGDDLPSPHPGAGDPPQPRGDPADLPRADGGVPDVPRPTTSPTTRPSWPRRPGCTCGRSSCAPGSPSPARTSRSPRPAPSWSSSPRATAGCA